MNVDESVGCQVRVAYRAWRVALLGVVACSVAACTGSMGLAGSESVRGVAPPPPQVAIAVIASDDSTFLSATVQYEGEELRTDELGQVTITWTDPKRPIEVAVAAPGFIGKSVKITELPKNAPEVVALNPVVLMGDITTPEGKPLSGASVTLGESTARTDDEGKFELSRAVGTEILLQRPAWRSQTVPWDGDDLELSLSMEPRMIRALRVGGDKAGDSGAWNALLELAAETGVNAFVVDTKDESGHVFHDSEVQLAHEIGAVRTLYDLDTIIKDMDDNDIYKITRIVTFQDNFLAKANPELAARNFVTGESWVNVKGLGWLDPTDRDAWQYPLDLAEEACERGFDEIQFDYIRFPSDGPISEVDFDELSAVDYYSDESEATRVETITEFLQEAHDLLNPLGCAVAADIFAITLESRSDEGIGQTPDQLSHAVDVLSPMIYTYTYGPGWGGWDNPNEHGPELVGRALDAGIPRLEGSSIYRPWLQRAFISSEEILAIQKTAEDRDLGWMLWSANTRFDASHLPDQTP